MYLEIEFIKKCPISTNEQLKLTFQTLPILIHKIFFKVNPTLIPFGLNFINFVKTTNKEYPFFNEDLKEYCKNYIVESSPILNEQLQNIDSGIQITSTQLEITFLIYQQIKPLQ